MLYLSQTVKQWTGSRPDVRSIPRGPNQHHLVNNLVLSFAHRSISGSSDPSISLRNGSALR